MARPVALRQRAHFAALLPRILHTARQAPAWQEPDRRHLRLWRHLLLAVLVQRFPSAKLPARAMEATAGDGVTCRSQDTRAPRPALQSLLALGCRLERYAILQHAQLGALAKEPARGQTLLVDEAGRIRRA